MIAINTQLLKEVLQLAPENPYRINVTIVARHHLELISSAPNEKQLIRSLTKQHQHDVTLDDLIETAETELLSSRERVAAAAVDKE